MKRMKKGDKGGVRQLRYLRASQGFTLIEMVIVLAIVTILAAVAVPSMIGMRDNLRYRDAGRQIASALRQARSLAVSSNQTVNVVINTANRTYQVGNTTYPALPSSVIIATSEPTTFTFSPNGSATFSPDTDGNQNNDETISIRDAEGTTKYTITISPIMGKIRIS